MTDANDRPQAGQPGVGGTGSAPGARHRLLVAAVFAVATALQVVRLPAGGGRTLYAEDGPEFVSYWLSHGSWLTVWHPYAGYQQFAPRVVSGLVVLILPPPAWAWGVTIATCLIVGAISALTFVASAELADLLAVRLVLAAVPVLAPITAVEAAGNLANLHSYMPWTAIFLALLRPRSMPGRAGVALASCAAALTEIQLIVLAPLMAWLAWRRPQSRWAAGGWVVGVGIQLLTWGLYPRPRPPGVVSVRSAVDGYAYNGAVSDVWVIYHHLGSVVRHGGWVLPLALLVGLLVLSALAAVGAPPLVRAVVIGAVLASAASWFVTYYVNSGVIRYALVPPAALAHDARWFVRWGTAAAMLLLLPLPLLAARIGRGRGAVQQRRTVLALLAVLLVVLAGDDLFRVDRGGPSWSHQVDVAKQRCAAGHLRTVVIPTAPRGWRTPVPCAALR